MFAAIRIPAFSLHALLRFNPVLRGQPVGLIDGQGRRARVIEVGGPAAGVAPGVTASQALGECPALQLVEPSPAAEREADALLLAAAWTLSPVVELTEPGLCTIDLVGVSSGSLSARLTALRARLAAEELPAAVGTGPTPLIARFAARQTESECRVSDPAVFLKPLPVSLLELTADEALLFADLGLHTLGAITALPKAALTTRLGARGETLWSQAAGEWPHPLRPEPFPVRHVAELELDEPVETLEPLLFVLRRFCERLALEVGRFGEGTVRMALVLKLDDEKSHAREFDLPEPTARAELLFSVIESHLAGLRTEAPIVALSLEAFPARRLEQQEGLFDTGLKDAPMFHATLARLAAVVGTGNVGTPRHADSHRPDAIVLEPPAAAVPERVPPETPAPHGPLLRRLRPPVPATIEITGTRPSFLVSSIGRGEISILRRSFRASGDWWTPEAWAQEEWDVRVGSELYRIRHAPEGWFIDGVYD